MHNPGNRADLQFRVLCKGWNGLTQRQKNMISELAGRNPKRKYKTVAVNVASASVAATTVLVFGSELQPIGAGLLAVLCYFYGLVFGGFLFDYVTNIRQ